MRDNNQSRHSRENPCQHRVIQQHQETAPSGHNYSGGGKMKYIVYIEKKCISSLLDTLDEAKQFAKRYIETKLTLKIEGYSSPAPVCEWIYDY